jgi:hypothetical protein
MDILRGAGSYTTYIVIGVIILVIIILIIIFVSRKKSKSSSSDTNSEYLTGIIHTPETYTVSKDVISKLNANIPQSNYAVSIWQYINTWSPTDTLKNILIIPNVLSLSMGGQTNDLNIMVYAQEGFYSLATNYGELTPVSKSNLLITTSDPGSIHNPPPLPTADTAIPKFDTGSNNVPNPDIGSNLVNKPQQKNIDNPPNPYIQKPPNPYIQKPSSDKPSQFSNIQVDNLTSNTVYKYNNAYIFVYNTYTNDTRSSSWREVRVAFSTSKVDEAVTIDQLYRGGTVNSLLLESRPTRSSHTGSSIPYNIANSLSDCRKWAWSCSPRPETDTCSTAVDIATCAPSISSAIVTPYPQSSNKTLTAAVYSITNSLGEPFFPDNQYFTFYYYDDSQMPVIISPSKQIQQYNPSVPVESMDIMSSDSSIYPMELPTYSTLFSYREPNKLEYNNVQESLQNQPTPLTYKISNMPLQSWTNILINMHGRDLTVFINGKIQSAFILPENTMPIQMNNEIQVTPSPSFDGMTANLKYIPHGVGASEAFNIYQAGHLGPDANAGFGMFSNRYTVRLVFEDKTLKK